MRYPSSLNSVESAPVACRIRRDMEGILTNRFRCDAVRNEKDKNSYILAAYIIAVNDVKYSPPDMDLARHTKTGG